MKRPNMKNVPSALKWLAEKRARIAGELQSAIQVSELLSEDVVEAREALQTAERLLAAARQKETRAIEALSSLDKVVVMYDQGIDPSLIEPINAWKGAYGNRGALKKFLTETLQAAAPNYLSTRELECATVSHFSLVFEHPDTRLHWYKGSFRGTIKLLASQDLVERRHSKVGYEVGYWRWKQDKSKTLAELRDATTEATAGLSQKKSERSEDGSLGKIRG